METTHGPSAYRLAEGLEAVATAAGGFDVYGYVVFTWWDRIRSVFEAPSAVVEVEGSSEPAEVKFHLGGPASPARANEPALTLSDFITALHALSEIAAAGPLYASVSFTLDNNTPYTYVLNIPTRGVRVRINEKAHRVLLEFQAVRKADRKPPPNSG